MKFAEAMDALGLTAAEVAPAFGLTAQTLRQMRLDPDKPGFRTPPEDWPRVLARLARERGGELTALADELEAGE